MFERILVPLDGSELSERALERATSLANSYGSALTLLTVMLRFPESRLHVPTMDERSTEHGQAYLGEVAARLPRKLRPDLVVKLGVPADEISDYARDNGIDLIVMSTHGTTGTDRIRHSLGSTAWKLLQDAPCPVLLVPVRPQAASALHASPGA